MTDGPTFGGRQLPQNVAAEPPLLGAILSNPKAFHAVAAFLLPAHFAVPAHGRIFAEAGRRILAGGVADALTMNDWWRQQPESAPDACGHAYLGRLLTAMVGILNAREYGRAIFDAAQRRDLIAAGEDLVNRAFDGEDVAGLASAASAAIDATLARAGGSARRSSFSLAEAVASAVAAGERAREHGATVGLSTGLPSLDEALGGMEGGALYVLAGRPGMGKTALGVQIAEAVARQGVGVLVVSLEMQAAQLARRILARLSGVPLGVLRKGAWTNRQMGAVIETQQDIAGLPLTIEDQSGLNPTTIAAKAREAHRRHGLGLLVVDHLHIVATPAETTRMGATWAVGQVSNALKALAKQMDIPVLALAQLNRGVEGREDKRPSLSDLRQSGEIEQDAEAVMLLYREEYYLGRGDPERQPGEGDERYGKRVGDLAARRERAAGKAELILPKVRDGEPGTVALRFDGPRTAFEEADHGR